MGENDGRKFHFKGAINRNLKKVGCESYAFLEEDTPGRETGCANVWRQWNGGDLNYQSEKWNEMLERKTREELKSIFNLYSNSGRSG